MCREYLESTDAPALLSSLANTLLRLPPCNKAAIEPRKRCKIDSRNPETPKQEFLRSGRPQARPSRQNAARGEQYCNQKFFADQPRKRKSSSLKPGCSVNA